MVPTLLFAALAYDHHLQVEAIPQRTNYRTQPELRQQFTMAHVTYDPWDLRPGIWGIRNYYTTLEERAIAGAVISPGYIAM
ncbi:MAG: hypothetical protein WAT61_05920, partial [Flavobacteriales bacterium]